MVGRLKYLLCLLLVLNNKLFTADARGHIAKPEASLIQKALDNQDVLRLFDATYKLQSLSGMPIKNFSCMCVYKGDCLRTKLLILNDKKMLFLLVC